MMMKKKRRIITPYPINVPKELNRPYVQSTVKSSKKCFDTSFVQHYKSRLSGKVAASLVHGAQ